MTRASRTRGPTNTNIELPRNPVPVPGSVAPAMVHQPKPEPPKVKPSKAKQPTASQLARRRELGIDIDTEPRPRPPAPPPPAKPQRVCRYTALRGEERSRLLERTSELATAGGTLEEIAKDLGVDTKMLMRWCAEDEAFFQALNPDWKVKAARVEDALYRRAIGYMTRTTTSKIVTKTGQPDEMHTTTKVEQIAPDPTSAILFLEVYKPEVYKRDKNNLLVITPPGDHQQNPRQLAMALLAVLREAAQTTIDITPALEAAE